ncbi:MAG: non-homologous end-joining DNA ligase LigD [Anaerolineae bacterium]
MPIDWLLRYWEAKADLTLPFLAGRATAMQLVFAKQIVYRRHDKDGSFIYIDSREELLQWARGHCYSFHPHLEDDILYFVLDIDRRYQALPFALVQVAAQEMANLLAELQTPHLLKFSGNRGFHFFWGFERAEAEQASGGDIWSFERSIIRFLRARLEERLQASSQRAEFYRVLREGDPITITNSADREHERSLLLDENIVHEMGSLRSPWSVHPQSGLVSLPLGPDELATFRREDAMPDNALKRAGPVALPLNPVTHWQQLLGRDS